MMKCICVALVLFGVSLVGSRPTAVGQAQFAPPVPAFGQTSFALPVTRNEMYPNTGQYLRGYDWLGLVRGERKYHSGVDYYCSDLKVMAANCGVVAAIYRVGQGDLDFGNTLILRHTLSNGTIVYTSYSHLASFAPGLVVGKVVARGDRLGTMGATGNSAGITHCHFELKTAATMGNPSAVGLIPRNTQFGYMPQNARNMSVGSAGPFGYFNPNVWYGNTNMLCAPAAQR